MLNDNGTPEDETDDTTVTGYTTLSFSKYVKSGDNPLVGINNIPYGTTYTVTENYTCSDAGYICTKEGQVTIPANETEEQKSARTIKAASKTVTITNTYTQVGSLSISKTLAGADKDYSGKNGDSKFKFTVRLVIADGMDKDFYISNVTPANTLTESNYTDGGADGKYFTIEAEVSENTPMTFGNLPIGTGVMIVETDVPAGWSCSPLVSVNIISAGNNSASFTNTFARTLTLRKADSRTDETITSSPAEFILIKCASISKTDLQAAIDGASTPEDKLQAVKDYATTNGGNYYPPTGTFPTSGGLLTLTESQVGGSFGTENFFFYEVTAPDGYVPDNTVTDSRIFHFETGDVDKAVTFLNGEKPTNVTVEKQDENGNGQPDAELDLYYRENIVPSTYNISKSITAPVPQPSIEIGGTEPSLPNITGESVTTYSYQYNDVTAKPDAKENAWILPRTDNDYIYLRDFNIGNTGEWDDVEVTSSGGATNWDDLHITFYDAVKPSSDRATSTSCSQRQRATAMTTPLAI